MNMQHVTYVGDYKHDLYRVHFLSILKVFQVLKHFWGFRFYCVFLNFHHFFYYRFDRKLFSFFKKIILFRPIIINKYLFKSLRLLRGLPLNKTAKKNDQSTSWTDDGPLLKTVYMYVFLGINVSCLRIAATSTFTKIKPRCKVPMK